VILRKLAAFHRQNSLALALRELGKLERSFFTLQWLQDPELRRRSHVGLNKGEQQNALRRAVFFNRLGEIRDRSYENQRHRASGLNLLVAASFYGIRPTCSALSITYTTKGTIRHSVIWPICRHSAGSISI
jgi:TnpA family transposase